MGSLTAFSIESETPLIVSSVLLISFFLVARIANALSFLLCTCLCWNFSLFICFYIAQTFDLCAAVSVSFFFVDHRSAYLSLCLCVCMCVCVFVCVCLCVC